MPVIELEWAIRHGADGKWYAIDTNAETTDGKWHEIVPIQPHGRCIDADALEYGEAYLNGHYELGDVELVTRKDIESAPTILPADPSVMYYPQVPGITPTVITEENE